MDEDWKGSQTCALQFLRVQFWAPLQRKAQMARPEAFEIWEAFETRPLSAGSSIPGVDGLPSRSMRRPRSSTRLQAEVEMNRAQAQLSELRKKLHAESREVERLQQCLDAANGEASHQRTLAQAAQVEIGKLHQRLAASEEAVQASQAAQDAAGRAAGDAERRLQAEIFELTARLRQVESGREMTQSDQIELKQRLEEKATYAATRAAEQGELAARAERRLMLSEPGASEGNLQHCLERNGSAVETRIADLIDLPLVLQKAHFSQLFDDPPRSRVSDLWP
ncbi:hypothetical protein AK812_SmicGene31513 [Symbiodinium microadriaticum]|uniref:Uncharacterized protein n=1 Tax=Symbiodinium microadriaticum TaxID=2951 RepID=A0A1Q9CWI2_SYMMI|nr:hypothetical protein AK812_SmicGene31513 [Symbiodinium microadriaticum]